MSSTTGPRLRPTKGAHGLTPWQVTTAARAFALALVIGTLLSKRSATESAPLLVAVMVIAAVSSALEWDASAHSQGWVPIGEAVLISVLFASNRPETSLLPYLAVPAIVAGVRHGWVTTANAGFVAAVTTAFTLTMSGTGGNRVGTADSFTWIVIGMGVGLLASWQSRSTRDLEARQAPYAAANQLVSQLHALASRGTVGLDSMQVAGELREALRLETGATRSAVYMHGRHTHAELLSTSDDDPVPVPSSDDVNADARIATIWLQGGEQRMVSVVLVRDDGWTQVLRQRAQSVADRFVLRLDTAILFDDVRLLATAEERNRIAREVHDGVAQEVVALGFLVDEIESLSHEETIQTLASNLRSEISRVVTELRLSIFDLRHQIADRKLSGALTEYVRAISHGTELRVHLLLDESGRALPLRTEIELLRIAQEAIGNVRRHAQASNLWVKLVSDGPHLRLDVEDDGVGKAQPKDQHWGLQTMRERAETIGADLSISARPGGGTAVCLQTRAPSSTDRETPP